MTGPDIAKTVAYSALALMSLAVGSAALVLSSSIVLSLSQVNRVLVEINRPCTVPVKGQIKSCGTLADVNQTLNTIRGTAGQIEVAAIHENKQLAKLDRQEAQLYADLHGNMVELHGTLLNAQELTASLTETSQQATVDLQTMNTTIEATQPVIENASLVVSHADDLMQDPSIHRFLAASADTIVQADGIVTDGRKVADKIEHDLDTPKTMKQKIIGYLPAGAKLGLIAACIATGTACP